MVEQCPSGVGRVKEINAIVCKNNIKYMQFGAVV